MVVLRLQAQQIRSALAKEIKEFEEVFNEIMEITNVFLASTDQITQSPSLVIVDRPSVVKTVCQFLASSNGILDFLDFQENQTGFKADIALENKVKDTQTLVMELLNTLILHHKAETYPGKENGLIYNEDVKVCGQVVLHRNDSADQSDVPDPRDEEVDLAKLLQYWHAEHVLHPLRFVPGTPWHKFFGNLLPAPVLIPELFRERKPMPIFEIRKPQFLPWLMNEIIDDYRRYRDLFDEAMLDQVMNRFSCLFNGSIFDAAEEVPVTIFSQEDLRQIPCPEYDLLGRSRMEALNAEINDPVLAGVSLLGHDIEPVEEHLDGHIEQWAPEQAYYSSLFSQLTQKEKSPIMKALWVEDSYHKEWDFMCAVYSEIREFLAEEDVPLQKWIQFAVKHLGIIGRDHYLAALGWELVQLNDGTHTVQRTAMRPSATIQRNNGQATNGLGLFMSCLNDGLPVANPLPIIAKLSDLAKDMICISAQPDVQMPSNTMAEFRHFARKNPQLAMAALFEVPPDHPLIAQGIAVHHVPMPGTTMTATATTSTAAAPAADPFLTEQHNANLALDDMFFVGPDPNYIDMGDGVPGFY
ncbi:hypothetical protein VTJ49DRAFT_558 [Mycothermus thermophilus]|uniref:Alpha box domain-containing protein n=1 Tax=Humicola insolens TaxID=85995 RepID=A0ABR3VET8_HUMIN